MPDPNVTTKPVAIYLLLDEDGAPRYVGKSLKLSSRIRNHRRNKPWLTTYLVLEIVIPPSDVEREKQWIVAFRSMGFTLENKNDGGSGAKEFTESQKQKVKDRLREAGRSVGWQKPLETTAKMLETKRQWPESRKREYGLAISARLKGVPKSAAHRAAMSASRRGVPASPRKMEVIRRIAAERKGVPRSPETIAKMSAAMQGHPVSPEARAKIGAAHKGKVISEKQRREQSIRMKGSKRTPEQKARIREARWGSRNAAAHENKSD